MKDHSELFNKESCPKIFCAYLETACINRSLTRKTRPIGCARARKNFCDASQLSYKKRRRLKATDRQAWRTALLFPYVNPRVIDQSSNAMMRYFFPHRSVDL